MSHRLVCYRCGREVEWIEIGGTPVPRCPKHHDQTTLRGLRDGEAPPEVESEPKAPRSAPRQGELFA